MSKRTHRRGARSSRAQQSHLCPGALEADAAGHRSHRLERILLEQLRTLIRDEAADPALDDVHLVSIQLSVDGGHARVGYAVEAPLAEEKRVERATGDALGRATGFLRARLADLLDLKRLPRLSFTFVGVQEPGASGSQGGGEPWLA